MLQVFILILTGLMTIGTISAQTTDSTLPKGTKLKTIKFKQYDYAIQGYVAKKEFVAGQDITILSPIPTKKCYL